MDIEEKVKAVTRNTIEIVTLDELRKKFEEGYPLKGYLGFEPSGLFHIGWIIWALKVKDLVDVGVKMYLLEATWHAWINDKLGGVMENIKRCAKYIRHSLKALNVPIEKIEFIDAESMVSDSEYWRILLKVAKNTSLARVKRALTIMGRKEEDALLDFSKLIYPPMQVTDIFYLDLDLALGGIDQRKAHMLAREVAPRVGAKKPIAIHTPLLTSLVGPGKMEYPMEKDELSVEVKMSKSKPESAIFIHDSPEEVKAKILKAYCPPKQVELNPILEINKYLLFVKEDFILHVDRPSKYGGPLDIYSYKELEELYVKGKLHPLDLKNATAEALNNLLNPIRRYFSTVKEAKVLLENMKSMDITR